MNKWSTAVVRVVLTAVGLDDGGGADQSAGRASGRRANSVRCPAVLLRDIELRREDYRLSGQSAERQREDRHDATELPEQARSAAHSRLRRSLGRRPWTTADTSTRSMATGPSRASASFKGRSADQKFILQPGETSDARFEFAWYASPQEIFGLSFQVDLAIREIDTIAGNQLRLGREHALHFSGLENRAALNPATSRMGTARRRAVRTPAVVRDRGAVAGGPLRRKPGVLQRGFVRR